MKTNFYLPILKSKLGEFTALAHLKKEQLPKIAPLFEITPLEWDQAERKVPKTLDEHLDSFCKKFISKWNNSNCFIDTHLLNWNKQDNTDKIEYVFDKLAIQNLSPIPVVSPRSSEKFLAAFINVTEKDLMTEIGLRVNPNDVTDPDFEIRISLLLERLNYKPEDCHLIFDLVASDFSEVDDIADSIVSILEIFPFLSEWKSFTIVGTAFPASRSIAEGLGKYKRNDWKFYNTLLLKLAETEYSRAINYGDYSIVNPEYFDFNPKVMKSSANIRYTHDDYWIVAKGKALGKASDYLQYKKLATDVFKSGFFLGELFSKGDGHLARCVRGQEKPGAPSIWNWVGNNHHFTKVLVDLYP